MTGNDARLSSGLSWDAGRPRLELADGPIQAADPGSSIAVAVAGPRRCLGWWSRGDGHHDCPFAHPIAATSVDAQCASCAQADSGRRLARGGISGDDRDFRLYLAWFGGRTVKVGITAQARGDARLYDQGALAYTFVARGRLDAVRGAEMAISASKLATERVRADRKVAWWWTFDPDEAARLLSDTAKRAASEVTVPKGLTWLDADIVDHASAYGLDGQLPDTYRGLEALAEGAVVAGDVIVAAGHQLLLSTVDGAVLCDTRRLAGWSLAAAPGPRRNLALGRPVRPERPDDAPTLF